MKISRINISSHTSYRASKCLILKRLDRHNEVILLIAKNFCCIMPNWGCKAKNWRCAPPAPT